MDRGRSPPLTGRSRGVCVCVAWRCRGSVNDINLGCGLKMISREVLFRRGLSDLSWLSVDLQERAKKWAVPDNYPQSRGPCLE